MPVTINGTTGIAGVDGSAGTPAVQGADTNTGIFFPAADTIAFAEGGAEVARFDSSGNFGIGTSSPGYRLDVSGGHARIRGAQALFLGNSDNTNIVGIYNGGSSGASTGQMIFETNSVERARIDSSGNLLVGKNSSGSATTNGFEIGASGYAIACRDTSAGYCLLVTNNNASGSGLVEFRRQSTVVGSISTNGTNTTYGTTSDYRLKEDVQPMQGALEKVAALKPVTYKWKSTGEASQGFIAHELQAVVSECVTGEKDAVDAEGNPIYQGIDTSFLVATLTAAIQEQQALINDLTARIAALEAA